MSTTKPTLTDIGWRTRHVRPTLAHSLIYCCISFFFFEYLKSSIWLLLVLFPWLKIEISTATTSIHSLILPLSYPDIFKYIYIYLLIYTVYIYMYWQDEISVEIHNLSMPCQQWYHAFCWAVLCLHFILCLHPYGPLHMGSSYLILFVLSISFIWFYFLFNFFVILFLKFSIDEGEGYFT